MTSTDPADRSSRRFDGYRHGTLLSDAGQDLVWRYVTPGKTALEGGIRTMAKCASSAMIHLGRRRNSNELYGAYGHELTFDEVQWLANWCFVRGQNLLYPHAFYYSVRGPRRDERPPDVGPNSAWWDRYKPYADACRRLCWVNTDSQQSARLRFLAIANGCPITPPKSVINTSEISITWNCVTFGKTRVLMTTAYILPACTTKPLFSTACLTCRKRRCLTYVSWPGPGG